MMQKVRWQQMWLEDGVNIAEAQSKCCWIGQQGTSNQPATHSHHKRIQLRQEQRR
jgi:hypothetical protein